jgi:hypothetical protein
MLNSSYCADYMNKSVPQANIFISLSEISPAYFQLYLKNCTILILHIYDSLMCLRITKSLIIVSHCHTIQFTLNFLHLCINV